MAGSLITSRRDFLKSTAAGTAGLAVAGAVPVLGSTKASMAASPLNQWPGRCVLNYNKSATTATASVAATVKTMVDDSIKLLTGQTTVGAAWKSLFPSLTSTTKIALKVNSFSTDLPSNANVVSAVAQGLQLMDLGGGATFPKANIIIYECNSGNTTSAAAGFNALGLTLNKESPANQGDGAHSNSSYAPTLKSCNYLINFPTLRGHATWCAVTMGFKSHYGTYPTSFHDATDGPSYLADINCTGPVYDKTVLTVLSALFGTHENSGGPSGSAETFATYVKTVDSTSTNAQPSTIIMGTDPVTVEFQGIKIFRLNKGTAYTAASMPAFLKGSAGLNGLKNNYNIGVIDEASMNVRKIINGVAQATSVLPDKGVAARDSGLALTHNRDGHTFIEYSVPQSHIGGEASIEIFNAAGARVAHLNQQVLGVRNHLSWDETSETGRRAPAGIYGVTVKSGSIRMMGRVSITG